MHRTLAEGVRDANSEYNKTRKVRLSNYLDDAGTE